MVITKALILYGEKQTATNISAIIIFNGKETVTSVTVSQLQDLRYSFEFEIAKGWTLEDSFLLQINYQLQDSDCTEQLAIDDEVKDAITKRKLGLNDMSIKDLSSFLNNVVTFHNNNQKVYKE